MILERDKIRSDGILTVSSTPQAMIFTQYAVSDESVWAMLVVGFVRVANLRVMMPRLITLPYISHSMRSL